MSRNWAVTAFTSLPALCSPQWRAVVKHAVLGGGILCSTSLTATHGAFSQRCPAERLPLHRRSGCCCGCFSCCPCCQDASPVPAWRYVISEPAQNPFASPVQLSLLLDVCASKLSCVGFPRKALLSSKAVTKAIETFEVNTGLRSTWEPEQAALTVPYC